MPFIKMHFKLMLLAFCIAGSALAQSTNTAPYEGDELKMVVVLSRHGVRSPTWPSERLNRYSSQTWPKWSVAPGMLTQRGFELLTRFGSFDRERLAVLGLLSKSGCEGAESVYFLTDTDQRTVESGRAIAAGMYPHCPLLMHSVDIAKDDSIFHATAAGVSTEAAELAVTELRQRALIRSDTAQKISEMQHVLQGCAPSVDCIPRHAASLQIDDAPLAVLKGKGDHIAELQGALPLASSFSEDFLLEFADGMSPQDIGWGKVDQAQIVRFLDLHTLYFDLIHRTPALASIEASGLLHHIAATLQQKVEGAPVRDAIGPLNAKVLFLVGHDTNLAGVASLLGVHWTLDGRNDDTPPGTEVAFELWKNKTGQYFIRIVAAMQTLDQMRALQTLTLQSPPSQQVLPLPDCGSAETCPWMTFQHLAGSGK